MPRKLLQSYILEYYIKSCTLPEYMEEDEPVIQLNMYIINMDSDYARREGGTANRTRGRAFPDRLLNVTT